MTALGLLCVVCSSTCVHMHVKSIHTFSYYCNELIIAIFSKHNGNDGQMKSCLPKRNGLK